MSYVLEKKSSPGAARWVQRSDFYSLSFPVSPTNTINEYFFAPYDMTLKEVKAYCQSGAASATGTYLLFVSDETASNNLLSAPGGFDLEAPNLPAATLTAVGLTGTVTNLSMPKGSVIRIQVASNNQDLVAEGLYIQLIFEAQ